MSFACTGREPHCGPFTCQISPITDLLLYRWTRGRVSNDYQRQPCRSPELHKPCALRSPRKAILDVIFPHGCTSAIPSSLASSLGNF